MTAYVCIQLDTDPFSGQQTCQTWQELPDFSSFIPDLSVDNVTQLTAAFVFFIAVCCIFKLLRRSH